MKRVHMFGKTMDSIYEISLRKSMCKLPIFNSRIDLKSISYKIRVAPMRAYIWDSPEFHNFESFSICIDIFSLAHMINNAYVVHVASIKRYSRTCLKLFNF